MSTQLSAEQIAELFAGGKEGALDSARHPSARPVRSIDFSRPTVLKAAEVRRFQRAHDEFCKAATLHVSGELREPVELEVVGCKQMTWAGALDDIPWRAVFARAATTSGADIVLCAEESFMLRAIERLLGGSFSATPPERELTDVDAAVALVLMTALVDSLNAVWQDLFGLGVSSPVLESGGGARELVPLYEPTLELTIELRDDSASSSLLVLVPYSVVEAALALNAQAPGGEDHGEGQADLSAVGVEVRAEIGAARLTIAELLALAEGDVVRLGETADASLVVGARTVHRVRLGRSGPRRAVQILAPSAEQSR